MGLVERIAAARADRSSQRSISTIDDYAQAVQSYVNGYNGGVTYSIAGEPAERAPNDLVGYATTAYASNGPVFALMAVRMLVFSAIRFQFQRLVGGRPSELFGTQALSLVEEPWPGGTTQDLLIRMIQDADLAGNSYWTAQEGQLVRLRPDWVDIVLEPRRFRGGILGYRRIGYLYTEGGYGQGGEPVPLLPNEVCHFAPIQDPLATYRGMSWLTPVIRELLNDRLMGRHQAKFFENAATPNMVVRYDPTVTPDKFREFKKIIDEGHAGAENAYRTLHLGGGADVTVVGTNMEQMAFTAVQGRGETRLAAAAGVPPVIVGFSEGLQGSSLNAGNFSAARRRFADMTLHPLWANAAGSLRQIIPTPPGSRLWYDARDVPALREDSKDEAQIQQTRAQTLRAYIDAGYTPESAVRALQAGDESLLEHTGLFSVQLQAPGSTDPNPPPTNGQEGTAQ
ncbi:phage portal protein [Actinomadura harenae]|uniref:Phage portal protein n=1 Tax=Actinomadura harenae TaxID=2483351 RepID=A0A3M2LV45_9ACTN|nr:phage portal protein [Actinomadura harenae]RMI39885.1 phage portal protein [Actinomadura harenae]